MEAKSEEFAKAIISSIKNQPSRTKKPPSKYQDSLNSLEDLRSEEQLSSKFYTLLITNNCYVLCI